MTHTLRYTRLSPLFDEMSLAAESSKNSGLMNLDSFLGNRVYHLPKSVSFTEGPESLKLIFKKALKT